LAVLSRHGFTLSLRSAYRWLVLSTGPCRGFHVPHWWDATGVGRLLYPGTVVLSWPTSKLRPPLPPPSGGSCSPVGLPSPGVLV